ncbi:MAG: alpha/beta fold hydrolase, partial [Proteobacteria bacterium]|nr:alpha/beta fold hydrolase [Pseudomonadota bacterium]
LPQNDPTRLLVVGHSEGGMIVARLARLEPGITHAAILSGSGATALDDLYARARRHSSATGADDPSAVRRQIAAVDDNVARILAQPDSIAEFAWGHPYRRWSSFLPARPADDLQASAAAVYIVHGTADDSVPIESFETLAAALAAANRAATIVRRENADHSLDLTGQAPPAGMAEVFRDVARWFAGEQQP